MITSTSNDKVKYVRSLHRRRTRYHERRFFVEGVRLVEEALRAGAEPALVFFTDDLRDDSRGAAALASLQGLTDRVYAVSGEVMEEMADTVTPQGILVVYPFLRFPIPSQSDLILVIDRLRDPGNCGALLRTAVAAGVDGTLVAPKTVDPYNPKAVRGGMGAHFHLPLAPDAEWEEIEEAVGGMQVLVAEPDRGVPYYEVDWNRPAALIVGGEARGASREALRLATDSVTIPMAASIESLNAVVATGVILFEALRQRRQAR